MGKLNSRITTRLKLLFSTFLLMLILVGCNKSDEKEKIKELINYYTSDLLSGGETETYTINSESYLNKGKILNSSLNGVDIKLFEHLKLDSIVKDPDYLDTIDFGGYELYFVYSKAGKHPIYWTIAKTREGEYKILYTSGLYIPNLENIESNYGYEVSFESFSEQFGFQELRFPDDEQAMDAAERFINGIPNFEKFISAVENADTQTIIKMYPKAHEYINRMPLGKRLNIKKVCLSEDDHYLYTVLCFLGENDQRFYVLSDGTISASKHFISIENEINELKRIGKNPHDLYADTDLEFINETKELLQ